MSATRTHGTATALDPARAADPARYVIGGAMPRAALRPVTREEVTEVLRAATREGLAVVPWGAGTALARARAPERYDLALDLTALDRVVEYEPEDMTLTAECGVTLGALAAELAARGQELPLEGARASQATLGGALAANASGPRRLRFGAPRDRILGARYALANGTLARTGGRVVKNVAGYALHRLACGSRGGLAVILEASLKLLPAPEARVALVFGASAAEIADGARWALFPRLEPAILTVVRGAPAGALPVAAPTAPLTVIVGLEDDARWVAEQEAACVRALGEPDARLEGDRAAALWQSLADLEDSSAVRLTFTTADNTPEALAPLLDLAPDVPVVLHALAGRLHAFAAPAQTAAVIAALAPPRFQLVDVAGMDPPEPIVAPQAAALALRARIRSALDPAGTLALGPRWERGGL